MSKWKHRLTSIDSVAKKAFCSSCQWVSVSLKDGHWKCNVARKEHRGKRKQKPPKPPRVKKVVGFSHLRGKACEICGSTERLCGDHNHATNRFRGTLCLFCNFGLGNFRDNVELLSKAILYLDTTKGPSLPLGE